MITLEGKMITKPVKLPLLFVPIMPKVNWLILASIAICININAQSFPSKSTLNVKRIASIQKVIHGSSYDYDNIQSELKQYFYEPINAQLIDSIVVHTHIREDTPIGIIESDTTITTDYNGIFYYEGNNRHMDYIISDGHTLSYTRDGMDRLINFTSQLNGADLLIRNWAYNANGRLDEFTEQQGSELHKWEYNYVDDNNRPPESVRRYIYNTPTGWVSEGLVFEYTYPEANTMHPAYLQLEEVFEHTTLGFMRFVFNPIYQISTFYTGQYNSPFFYYQSGNYYVIQDGGEANGNLGDHGFLLRFDNEGYLAQYHEHDNNIQGPMSSYYSEKTIDFTWNSIVANEDEHMPVPEQKLTTYPNPFRDKLTLSFEAKTPQPVEISVYNIKGQLVKKLHTFQAKAGQNRFDWDGYDNNGRHIGEGLYFVQVKIDSQTVTRKCLSLN
jgi:hypothetical protein